MGTTKKKSNSNLSSSLSSSSSSSSSNLSKKKKKNTPPLKRPSRDALHLQILKEEIVFPKSKSSHTPLSTELSSSSSSSSKNDLFSSSTLVSSKHPKIKKGAKWLPTKKDTVEEKKKKKQSLSLPEKKGQKKHTNPSVSREKSFHFSTKLLNLALQQQEEIENEENQASLNEEPSTTLVENASISTTTSPSSLLIFDPPKLTISTSTIPDQKDSQAPLDQPWTEMLHLMTADDTELALFDSYFTPTTPTTTTAPPHTSAPTPVPPALLRLYTETGTFLSQYTSGPLPKAVTALPGYADALLFVTWTRPSQWSLPALAKVTQVCLHGLPETIATKYVAHVVLPRFRAEVAKRSSGEGRGNRGGRVSAHVVEAIKRCWYKPAAACRGLVVPMCKQGCTLREMAILSGILRKLSIPLAHASAMMLMLVQASMPCTPSTLFLIRVVLEKKYALPLFVVDALVHYFHDRVHAPLGGPAAEEPSSFPVLFHQCVLVLAQHYKHHFTLDHLALLRALVQRASHPLISPCILRELDAARANAQEDVEMNMVVE